MIDQIDIKNFFVKCGPTSTPILRSKRISGSKLCDGRNDMAKLGEKDVIWRLLESKEVWPLAFGRACQNFLNDLRLHLDTDFLLEMPTTAKDKSSRRRPSPMTRRRSKSGTRDRSASPLGARNMNETKWERNTDVALLLVDEILRNHEDLPEMFLLHDQSTAESKAQLEMLLKSATDEQRKRRARELSLPTLGQCVRLILAKMGVLLPELISRQMVVLKSLTSTASSGGARIVRLKSRIEAAQTLMLNVPKRSRNLVQKLVNAFRILSNLPHLNADLSQLALILRPSLFEDRADESVDQLKLCSDFIMLSDRIFDAPPELLRSLKETINTRVDVCPPFDEVGRVTAVTAATAATTTTAVTPRRNDRAAPPTKLHHFFNHTKTVDQSEPVVLTAIRHVLSPDKAIGSAATNKSTNGRKSFTEFTRKLIEKSISPFKRTKEYALADFYRVKKPKRENAKLK